MSPQPRQPDPPSPSPGEAEASSTASAPASSTDRAGAGIFVGDPGPAFDPRSAPEPAPVAPDPGIVLPEWEESTVRGILNAQGVVLHQVAGAGRDDWLYLEHELGAIAPPLTRILNRYDATRAAAATGDEIAVVIGLSGYIGRSIMVRRAAVAAQPEPEPITGVAAPEGTGPESDPAYQAANNGGSPWTTTVQ